MEPWITEFFIPVRIQRFHFPSDSATPRSTQIPTTQNPHLAGCTCYPMSRFLEDRTSNSSFFSALRNSVLSSSKHYAITNLKQWSGSQLQARNKKNKKNLVIVLDCRTN